MPEKNVHYWVAVIGAAIYVYTSLAPSALMPWIWVNLRSVQITDASDAMGAIVTADRSTHFAFTGRYTVTFRATDNDFIACEILSQVIRYKPGLSGSVTKPLWWWVGGKAALATCQDEGLHDGSFYAVTCQNVLLFEALSIARRCVRSNDFTLGDGK